MSRIFFIGCLLLCGLGAWAQKDAPPPPKALKMYEQGNDKYVLRHLDDAKAIFEKTVKKYPRYVAAHRRLAEIY
ncbi:MAG: hypothetical protein IPL33_16530 [Sphingobacteriales bacterium]|nr:hypothetical protein [Sphingobacteriales bacterium]